MNETLITTISVYNDAIQEYEVDYNREDCFWEIISYLNRMYDTMNITGFNDAFDKENIENCIYWVTEALAVANEDVSRKEKKLDLNIYKKHSFRQIKEDSQKGVTNFKNALNLYGTSEVGK